MVTARLRPAPRNLQCHQRPRLNAKTFKDALWRFAMPRQIREEEQRLTEDEIARRILGPRGVPGGQDTAKMTPRQAKNIPKTGEFDGHTA